MARTSVMHRGLSLATAALLLLLPLRLPAAGQADETASLRRQVDELRRTLETVQHRLDAIEARPGVSPTSEQGTKPEQVATPAVRSQGMPATGTGGGSPAKGATLTSQMVENWQSLRAGMSEKEVRSLLGEPTRTFELSGQPVWYYYYMGVGGGSVMFTDKNGQLLSWQRPPFHGWW